MRPVEGRRTGFGMWEAQGVSRREFLRTCAIAAAAVGLPAWTVGEIAEAAAGGRPPVIWLHFQECTGCSETLLRASLSLIHISEPTRLGMISYAVFCLKKKNKELR